MDGVKRVSTFSTVRYDTNSYSVPVQFCGKTVSIKALSERIEAFSAGEIIAVHQRCFGRQQSVYQLEHYLLLLELMKAECEARQVNQFRRRPKAAGFPCQKTLDELSYFSFNRHQSELLFKVISDCGEKSSTIVTTNLLFSRWTELFENSTMVAALEDRLTFRSHVLDMNGEPFRLKSALA